MNRWLLILIPGILILAWSLRRDIHYARTFPVDARNRVVGARLVRDGRMPYFYKWRPGDGFRYYDPFNFDEYSVSNISSSPFFLHLLSPIAELPQTTFDVVWLCLEYALLAAMTLLGFFCAGTTAQRQWVIGLSFLFLLTNAWKDHISGGQTYLWIPALAMGFFVAIRKPGSRVLALTAGVCAAVLVLIRPNTILFFVPFLFLARRYSRSWWIVFMLPPLLLAGWTLGSRRERSLWVEYIGMIRETVAQQQDLSPSRAHNAPNPHFINWEGVDIPTGWFEVRPGIEKVYSENANGFVLVDHLFNVRLPPVDWEMAAFVLIAAFCGVFFFLHRPFSSMPVSQLAIFAFCVYMISDFCSPVYRHQYYTVQWLFPLLLAAASWDRGRRRWLLAMAAGLVILSVHFPFLKMQNTIAEFAIMAILLGFSLFTRGEQPPKASPASLPKSG